MASGLDALARAGRISAGRERDCGPSVAVNRRQSALHCRGRQRRAAPVRQQASRRRRDRSPSHEARAQAGGRRGVTIAIGAKRRTPRRARLLPATHCEAPVEAEQ
jgi:hypothetical protein